MKSSKKALAFALAAAMVVTAVPVTNADAATTAKLSAKKVTVAAGTTKKQTKSITVKTPSKWKNVKVTATSSNKKIAKVKTSKKTVKITAVKKGTAKVTVKVTAKNGKKKVTKKLTAKVNVVNAALKFTNVPSEMTAGSETKLNVKKTPTVAKVKFSSSDKNVATVSKSGVVKAVTAGAVTITAKSDYGKKITKKITVNPVKESFEMTSLEVKAADTLVAKFAAPVNVANTTLTLKRGTTSITFTPTWNADNTEVTVKTAAKMATGTYELTAADKTDAAKTTSKTVNVEKQKATKIVIKNKTALTGGKAVTSGGAVSTDNNRLAYVYYDVEDQYGQSMRTSVNIEWSSSVKIAQKNTATGMLTLERTDGKDFTYGEQIFITGVNAQTGLSVTETLTVGAKQAVDAVKMAGFVKKGTSKLLKALPKDFKASEYYMLYNVVDQNGCDMKTARFNAGDTIDDITFVSSDPLVISEMTKAGATVTIDNQEYDTVLVKPGIRVEKGGEVNVTAIANKTGKKTVLNVPVLTSAVLKSFTIGTPADIVADGEKTEIPYTAIDTDGNKVTNFQTMAKQETFNALSFTVSGKGMLALEEQNDGTAKLFYYDEPIAWDDSQSTDGQDRVVSLTAIVVGGETSNQTLHISDKARPTGVKNVNFKNAYVEGDTATIELTKQNKDDSNAYIEYVDQYGRNLNEYAAQDFFDASAYGDLKGTDFSGYTFGTMVTYTGNGNSKLEDADNLMSGAEKDVFLTSSVTTAAIQMGTKVLSVASGEGCKFAVTKFKRTDGYSNLDRTKNYDYNVVDIKKVQGLTANAPKKVWAKTQYSDLDYLADSDVDGIPASIESGYTKDVSVSGTYAGKKVDVPAAYFSYTGDILTHKAGSASNKIDAISGGSIKANKLYNFTATNANYARKDAEDTLIVTVDELYSNDSADLGTELTTPTKLSDLKKTVLVSDAAPVGTTLKANADATVLVPGLNYDENHNGTIEHAEEGEPTKIVIDADKHLVDDPNKDKLFTLKDQYDVEISGMSFEVKDINEVSADTTAYADNNFAVSGNTTGKLTINGAERGDTFTVVASYKKLSASIKVTTGSDAFSWIADSANGGNVYLTEMVKNYLEPQRLAGLQ